MIEWRNYSPLTHEGKLCYYLCSQQSHLPIRDVLNDQGKGYKPEPNYETTTYNRYASCNQKMASAPPLTIVYRISCLSRGIKALMENT